MTPDRRGRCWRRCVLVVTIPWVALRASSQPWDVRGMFAGKFAEITTALRHGDWENYATGYAWHLPHGYEAAARARLNETTWGGGFGRTFDDETGARHSVYVMAFADSHTAPQFNFGYAWQRYWRATRNVSVGGGYLAFVFSRADVAGHCPIPALLPCASIRLGKLEVISVFVPRVSREIQGDVLFVYLRKALGNGRKRERHQPPPFSEVARTGR